MNNTNSNNIATLPLCVFEEIGFEGLEGITIEGLWKRISVRFKLKLPLNCNLRNKIWSFILNAKCLQFYTLQEDREPLKLFDRADAADPFFGGGEPASDQCPYNLYKYNPISTQDVRGSCEHFDTRKEIQRDILAQFTIDEAEEGYGRRLVIVASQSLRNSLLISPTIPREIELNIACYCILERLGRARFNGELAHGKYSLADIGGDPIAFHSIKKKLLRRDLIKCQSFTQNIDGTNVWGLLIHLPRFYAQFKPRHVLIMEKITNILKSKPNCMAEYHEIKSHFEESHQRFLSRMFKSPFFHKFVITDTRVPFRAVYPNATVAEWRLPKKDTERTLNVLQLRDPNIDSSHFWDKCDNTTDDIDEEEGDFLDDSHAVRDLPLLHQLYKYIESSKGLGVSEAEASAYLGQSKLNGRTLVRNLMRMQLIEFYITNNKRQTVRRYVVPKYNQTHKETIADIIDVKQEKECRDVSMVDSQITINTNESASCDETNADMFNEVGIPTEEDESFIEEPFKTEKDVYKSQISGNIIVKVTEIDEVDNVILLTNLSSN